MVGDKIKYKRIENGWTQEELAKRMGYKSKSTINKIELGVNDVNQKNIVKFADVLGTTVPFLMGWDEEEKRANKFKKLMEGRKESLFEIAKDIGVDVKELVDLEKGKIVSIGTLKKVASYFNVDIDSLIDISISKEDKESDVTASVRVIEHQKKWNEEVGEVKFTDEEMNELIDFAKYIISKRKKD